MLYAVLGKPGRDTSLVGLGWPRGIRVLLLVSGDLDGSMLVRCVKQCIYAVSSCVCS